MVSQPAASLFSHATACGTWYAALLVVLYAGAGTSAPLRRRQHLAVTAPRTHDGDGRDSTGCVGLVPDGRLPLAVRVLLLRIWQREALQEQEHGQLLE
eukprot:scaffold702_cov119-Isochrysis_galbana.AAC.5